MRESVGWMIAGFFVILALVVWGIMAAFGIGLYSKATAEVRGQTSQRELTQANGQYRIAKYNYFYDMCAAVQSREGEIRNIQAELDTATDPGRKLQLQSAITAQRNSRTELITQYNAEASKTDTAAKFKASDLPYSLNDAQETTTCAA